MIRWISDFKGLVPCGVLDVGVGSLRNEGTRGLIAVGGKYRADLNPWENLQYDQMPSIPCLIRMPLCHRPVRVDIDPAAGVEEGNFETREDVEPPAALLVLYWWEFHPKSQCFDETCVL